MPRNKYQEGGRTTSKGNLVLGVKTVVQDFCLCFAQVLVVFGEGFRFTFSLLNINDNFFHCPTPQIVLPLPAQVPSLKSCPSTLSRKPQLLTKNSCQEQGIHRTGILRMFGQRAPAFHKFPETVDTDI